MSKLGFIIDTERNEIRFKNSNEVLKLGSTESGHYKVPICGMVQEYNITVNSDRLFGATTKEKNRKL